MEKKSTRDGFGDELLDSGPKHDNLVVLSADLSSPTRTAGFAKACPQKFFEVGIAEANMIGISSGLSMHGYRVFLSSFGSFLTGRYDQIRVSLAYSERPVVLVGTHSGLAIGKDGSTQMGLEDVNLMRALPNMKIMQPATYTQARAMTRQLMDTNDLVYLRLGRQPVHDVGVGSSFGAHLGTTKLRDGDDLTIAFSGCVADLALDVYTSLYKRLGVHARVLNFSILKPFDRLAVAAVSGPIVTIEDHSIIGGLGTTIAEVISEQGIVKKLLRIGINDTFAGSGAPDDLYAQQGMTCDAIINRIERVIL